MRKALLIFGSVLVLGLLVLVTAVALSDVPRRYTGRLTDALPREAAGWTRRDVPIAGSSAGVANVLGILNFSQAEQVLYEKDGRRVLVYVAYWEPGRVSVVDAGSHNPDSCWVNAGCVRTERRHGVAGLVGGRALRPYEYGQYLVPGGGRQNVVFWHLVNGSPNRYEEQESGWRDGLLGRLERLPLLLKDVRDYGLNQKSEQMFIRLSFSASLAETMADPEFARLMHALAALGLFEDRGWN
ncbi:MAG: exosortase-associated EpsI family protein [Opitutales bacterium]